MHTLIIGGSRGIGNELAKLYTQQGDRVTVTGRTKPDVEVSGVTFSSLDLSSSTYSANIAKLINSLEPVDRVVFSQGYFQEGTITDLSEAEILDMIQVCGTSVILIARALLQKQGSLAECVVITSSSQWTPRKLEPIYNFTKAGIGHFSHALSLDERVHKVLVAGPTGTKTAFHAKRIGVDMSTYHEPAWVAEQIFEHAHGDYRYKFIKILRDPASVEVAEEE